MTTNTSAMAKQTELQNEKRLLNFMETRFRNGDYPEYAGFEFADLIRYQTSKVVVLEQEVRSA